MENTQPLGSVTKGKDQATTSEHPALEFILSRAIPELAKWLSGALKDISEVKSAPPVEVPKEVPKAPTPVEVLKEDPKVPTEAKQIL
jgi:hypothetical protein